MDAQKILGDLGSKKPRTAAAAMRNILKNGQVPAIRKGLLRLLANNDHLSRGNAVVAIGRLGIKEATPQLIKMLEDSDLRTRCFCAAALGKLGDKNALPALRRLARDTSNAYQSKLVDSAIEKLNR